MKKLQGYAAELFKEIIHDGKSVIDVEADPELKQKLLQAKKDILDGKVYSTDEVIEKIDDGEL